MEKFKKFLTLIALSFALSNNVLAVGWTAEIQDVRVWENNKAEIFVSNPRDPNPAGSTWNCDYNLILIGNPVGQSMLSTALTAYAAGKTIRVNVQGSGISCSINYIETKAQ